MEHREVSHVSVSSSPSLTEYQPLEFLLPFCLGIAPFELSAKLLSLFLKKISIALPNFSASTIDPLLPSHKTLALSLSFKSLGSFKFLGWCLLTNQLDGLVPNASIFSLDCSTSTDTSKLLLLLFFNRLLFSSSSLSFLDCAGFVDSMFISVADDVRFDNIDIRSVFEHTIPVGWEVFGCSGGFGYSDALLFSLGIVGKGVPMKSEYLLYGLVACCVYL